MADNALTRILNECSLHNDSPDCFELFYGKYTLFYSGSFYGYVYETNDPDSDQNEHEYTWGSFDEMLDSVVDEIGKTWRDVLEETASDKIFIGW